MLVILLGALSQGLSGTAAAVATPAAGAAAPIAMGVNGHPFSQPNYMVGPVFVASGSAAGISYEEQLDEVAALAPGGGAPFYYRFDLNCGWMIGKKSKLGPGLGKRNATQGAAAIKAVQGFVRAAVQRNLTVLPILFPDLGTAGYTDSTAVTEAAKDSTEKCAAVLLALGLQTFEIGQEWDNLALLPGRGGDKPAEYNKTVYAHLLAELRGMSAGVRAASSSAQIGVNNGGWIHWAWFEMLIQDKLDFDFCAYHWYSEMGDLNSAGGENVWAKLVSFGKDVWITELDRRGGSSTHAPGGPCGAMDQPTYLAHEIALLASLSANASNNLKAIFTYELYDEPHQGNGYPQVCATGNTSRNGESCYGLVGTEWSAGPKCDQYPSCNFTATERKPAWAVVKEWAKRLKHDDDTWRACDVTSAAFGAVGDAKHDDTNAIRLALKECDEVLLPAGSSFLTGPLNLTSNQHFVVDGTLLASANPADYPMVAPLISYGWSIDSNCFPFLVPEIVPGALNYQAIINSWNSSNVTVSGSGVIDGQGEPWWERCTKCHYKPPIGDWPNANSSCLEAGRPMLLQFTFVTGLNVYGSSVGRPLTIQNSPFWTFTPTFSQDIRIKDLVILAPINTIGNTDGIDISSSRNAIIENVMIKNSDDGICMNSGAWEYGMNLAIPTENVLVKNITCPAGGRGGFRVGIQPGGVRNVTYRDSVLNGERGLSLLGAVGGGGFIHDVLFDNITNPRGISFGNYANPSKLRPSNRYLPKVWNVEFRDIHDNGHCGNCAAMVNGSVCPNVTFTDGTHCGARPPPPPQIKASEAPVPIMRYGCKRNATDQWGSVIKFPWPVCIPMGAPVNVNSSWPNWGPVEGNFPSLQECKASGCV